MALSFWLFKPREEGNIFLFFSELPTLSTFYVLPNLLNSVVVCGAFTYITYTTCHGSALVPS